MSTPIRHLVALSLVSGVAIALAGCTSISDHASSAAESALNIEPPVPPRSRSSPPVPPCGDPTASLRPMEPLPAPGAMPAGSFMRRIQDRGRLIVGVDQNTLLLGYLNPFNGQIEGFDIDMLRQVAKAVFGNPNAIEFKAISSAQRIPVIQDHSVDIVADAMTITCKRRKEVSFSTVYYEAGQRVLVPSNSRVRGIHDLADKKVCATVGSTSIENIKELAPRDIPYSVPLRTDCLVKLQEGKVAAISTDDAILYGFRAQDPYTKIVGPRFTEEPYGMAINKGHPEFVRFVNAVLARERSNGTWASIYDHWLGPITHKPAPSPPRAHYRE
jgi:polar amino acid transport system substrate-binding protein